MLFTPLIKWCSILSMLYTVAKGQSKTPDPLNTYGFTLFRIEDAQYAILSSLITAHNVGVLNEKRCKKEDKPVSNFWIELN